MERESNSLLVFFAAKLKTLRNAKGWSQEALGKRLGYSGEMVSKVETGDARPSGQFAGRGSGSQRARPVGPWMSGR
jgi:ribosome-binding protein aMBF1 (putative translation factor)